MAAYFGLSESLAVSILHNFSIDVRDSRHRTPLSYASQNGHQDTVRLLLDKNAQVDTRDRDFGQTPLSRATENGHESIVRLLLDKNAQVDLADNDGQTPLSWAAVNGHESTVRLLLDKNAQVDAKDTEGRTALRLAAIFGNDLTVSRFFFRGKDRYHGSIWPECSSACSFQRTRIYSNPTSVAWRYVTVCV